MKTETYGEAVAQGATAWNEKKRHQEIMKKLDDVCGRVTSYFYINGNYYNWSTYPLEEKDALEIAERGNHEEIMYMIHQYGKADTLSEEARHCQLEHRDRCLLPESVQEIIAKRNDWEEIGSFLHYNGFGAKGQDVILERGDHSEIMRYLMRHGLLPQQQRKLKARNIDEEFNLHIKFHGLCDELLDEMFARMEKSGDFSEFYSFVSLHELSVPFQKRMLKVVDEKTFKFYVDRFGLWSETHVDLVKERSDDDILYYLAKHRYLGKEGEHELAVKGVNSLSVFYINNRVNKQDYNFAYELMKVKHIDYAAFREICLQAELPNFGYSFDDDLKVIVDGSSDDVLELISKNARFWPFKLVAELFFRNNQKLFEAYLNDYNK